MPGPALWMRRTLGTSCAIVLLGVTAAVSAAPDFGPGSDSATQPASLWLATSGGVVEIARGDASVLRQLPESGDARALALDPERGLLWHVSNGSLSLLPLSVDPGLSLPLRLEEGERVFLERFAADGSAWVGLRQSVRGYGPSGQVLLQIPLEGPLRSMALFPGRSAIEEVAPAEPRLWVATGEAAGDLSPFAIVAYDLVTGEELARMELAEGAEVTAVASEPERGGLWVAFRDRLSRFDEDGSLLGETLFAEGGAPLTHLSPDGFGGLWAARLGTPSAPGIGGSSESNAEPFRLLRFDSEGSEVLSLTPFAAGETLRRLRLDPATRTLWAATSTTVLRLSAAGHLLETLDLGAEAELQDLVPGSTEPDTEPPSLAFLSPTEGATVETARPEIRLSWSDTGAGVDPASLAFEVAGLPLAAHCETSPEGARCSLAAPLPEGDIHLTATVTDFLANPSAAAAVSFTVELERTDDPDNPGQDPDPAPFFAVPVERGLEANKVYLTDNDIEAISPSNGGLTLSIPLGQTYSVGPLISYQVRATYNSNIWQRAVIACGAVGINCPPGVQNLEVMLPNPASNAGVGWEVHFGRLFSKAPPSGLEGLDRVLWPNIGEPDDGTVWTYVAPDGSNHSFYNLLNRPSGAFYTKDGSYLRLRQPNANRTEVHHPNGVVSVFEKTAGFAGTLFCGGGVSGCWRFKEQVDPYGNRFTVTYSTSGTQETWTVKDSVSTGTQRVHYLRFSFSNSARRGGDGQSPFIRANGDEWGDLRRVLQSVDMAAFGNTRAVYGLSYLSGTISRGCPITDGPTPGEPITLDTVRLRKISPPGIQPYIFTTDPGSGVSGCSQQVGKITAVELPSRGEVRYSWGNWSFPTRCSYRTPVPLPPVDPPLRYQLYGVTGKTRVTSSGSVEGHWSYNSELLGGGSLLPYGPNCSREEFRRTTLDGPVVDSKFSRDVFYTAVTEGPRIPISTSSIDTWQATDSGLPFTKETTIGTTPGTRRFLSRETYLCPASQACTASQKRRSVYVRYAAEWNPLGDCDKSSGHAPSCFAGNSELVVERTIFHKDGNRYVERRFESQTGFGLSRNVVTRDNFNSGGIRAVSLETGYLVGHAGMGTNGFTGYFNVGNPSQYTPSAGSRWILHPASFERRIDDGHTYRLDMQYNSFGLLTCARRRVGAGRSSSDVVTRFTLGSTVGVNAGLPVTETHFGGDGANVSTSTICPSSEPSSQPTYTRNLTYSYLQLASRQIGGFPFEYRVLIDRGTGFVSTGFDTSDQRTDFLYDALGRLLRVSPAASLGEARTELVHRSPVNADPSVEIKRRSPSGTLLSKTIREFDSFGRLDKLLLQRPKAGGGWEFVKQELAYDAAGRRRYQTTLQEDCVFGSPGCTFNRLQRQEWQDYLPDGRAQTVISPDGSETEYTYFGIHRVKEEVEVRTSLAASEVVENNSFYDPQGRLERIARGEGVNTASIWQEAYKYDPAGRLLLATRTAGLVTQERSYGWDGRGFLTEETFPELGIDGSSDGSIEYLRNAFGLMRSRNDGVHTLVFEYDGAGRRTGVKEGDDYWQKYFYGTSTSASNLSKGKLVEAIRHNYTGGPGPLTDWAVSEFYTYGGALGQVSQRTTSIRVQPASGGVQVGPSFVTNWSYDSLGAVKTLGYPRCTGAVCTGTQDLPGAPHTVTTAWEVGLPLSLTSDRGLSATYAYHRNLTPVTADYGNSTKAIYGPDPNGLARPRRIRHVKGAQTLFDSGLYDYDASGNIWKIGTDRFIYDRVGRLTLGTVKQAGSGHQETYTYDGFDNVLSRQRDSQLATLFTVDAKNRVRGFPTDVFYDAAGHTTRLASQNIDMEWDALGMQLVFKRQLPSFQQQVYIYGPGNLRILSFDSQDGALTWNQRDLRGKVLRTWRHTGSLDVSSPLSVYRHEKDYLYGLEGMFASRTAAGVERYFHSDHLGSPRAISNSLGQSVGQHHYYPFGHEVVPNAPYDDRFCKFTGHERDPNGGTDYMLGRTYAESFQRFLSVDPGRDGWNLYAYARNNPVKFVDPNGLEVIIADKRDRAYIEKRASKNKQFRAVLDYFGPGTGRDLIVKRADPGNSKSGRPLGAKAEPTYGREPTTEEMLAISEAAGGGEVGDAVAEAFYDAEVKNVSSAVITLGETVGKQTIRHEFGHIEQAIKDPQQAQIDAEVAKNAGSTSDYKKTASEIYADEFAADTKENDP